MIVQTFLPQYNLHFHNYLVQIQLHAHLNFYKQVYHYIK